MSTLESSVFSSLFVGAEAVESSLSDVVEESDVTSLFAAIDVDCCGGVEGDVVAGGDVGGIGVGGAGVGGCGVGGIGVG